MCKCCVNVVVQFKIVHWLHWSNFMLSRIRPELDPTCHRCKQAPTSLLHMFWTCPILEEPVDPSLFCFIWCYTTGFTVKLLSATCWPFAHCWPGNLWKDPLPPMYSHWTKKIMQYFKLEKIWYSLQGSVLRFYAIWQPFLTFVENMKAENVTPKHAQTSVKLLFLCLYLSTSV